MPAPAELIADTAVRPLGGGRYTLDLSPAWSFLLPSGGVLATASLRAAVAELVDPALRLVSTTTVFCTPLAAGAIDLEVRVLRRGASAAQVRIAARGRGPDEVGLETVATFARDRQGPEVIGERPPAVPPPDQCAELTESRAPFFANFETRLAAGTPLRGAELRAGPARYARWFRYRAPPLDRGLLDRLALPPLADTMPAALAQALGPGEYRFYAPSLDLTVQIVDDTDREWVLVASEVPRAHVGWAVGRSSLWDDRGRLLAIASQGMLIKGLAGVAPTVDATLATREEPQPVVDGERGLVDDRGRDRA